MKRLVLDANVLYSNHLRGFFLWMASRGLFQIFWSHEIWDEVFRNYSSDPEKEELFRQDVEQVIWRSFPESMKKLRPARALAGLPDRNDEHVVALALQEGVENIVTFNLKDFPEGIMQELSIRCSHPDLFLIETYDEQRNEVVAALREHLQALRKTKLRKSDYFHKFKTSGAEKFAMKLESADAQDALFDEVWST
jgi:predicted nucleic acid-binding protein